MHPCITGIGSRSDSNSSRRRLLPRPLTQSCRPSRGSLQTNSKGVVFHFQAKTEPITLGKITSQVNLPKEYYGCLFPD